jgi:hypothetical protein
MQNNTPLKKRERKVKYFIEKTSVDIPLRLNDIEIKKRYSFNNNNIDYVNFEKISTNNIFQNYNKDIHSIYSSVSSLLKTISDYYEINKSRQYYYLYGKINTYSSINNKFIYDFPGIDIPVFHGFMPLDGNLKMTISNSKESVVQVLSPLDIFITHPSNLIQFEVDLDTEVLEFYISPCGLLSNNELNLWVPIL